MSIPSVNFVYAINSLKMAVSCLNEARFYRNRKICYERFFQKNKSSVKDALVFFNHFTNPCFSFRRHWITVSVAEEITWCSEVHFGLNTRSQMPKTVFNPKITGPPDNTRAVARHRHAWAPSKPTLKRRNAGFRQNRGPNPASDRRARNRSRCATVRGSREKANPSRWNLTVQRLEDDVMSKVLRPRRGQRCEATKIRSKPDSISLGMRLSLDEPKPRTKTHFTSRFPMVCDIRLADDFWGLNLHRFKQLNALTCKTITANAGKQQVNMSES